MIVFQAPGWAQFPRRRVSVLTYVLAALTACANATFSVLQRKANRAVPRKENLAARANGGRPGVDGLS